MAAGRGFNFNFKLLIKAYNAVHHTSPVVITFSDKKVFSHLFIFLHSKWKENQKKSMDTESFQLPAIACLIEICNLAWWHVKVDSSLRFVSGGIKIFDIRYLMPESVLFRHEWKRSTHNGSKIYVWIIYRVYSIFRCQALSSMFKSFLRKVKYLNSEGGWDGKFSIFGRL